MVQEMNKPFITLRIKFVKVGSLQYVSHLDLVRTMHKVLIRAKLPLWYSEGFNPKPKMVFSPPLSIGAESVCEFMDIRLTESVEPEIALRAINENVTDELRALDAYYPERKLSEIAWYSYSVKIHSKLATEALCQKCNEALNSDTLPVIKKGKNGDVEKDIRPLVKFASAAYENGEILLNLILCADSSSVLNPELVIKLLKDKCNILDESDLLNEFYTIRRERAYLLDMSEYR